MVSSAVRPSTLSDNLTGDLVLRVCGSSRHGQIVRLRSAKCTIGSGPRCTLRLRARGVRPIHCLILRGANRTVIRRWSPDTRLNGQAFTDAKLVEGDRLSIGTIELEVLESGRLQQLQHEEQTLTEQTQHLDQATARLRAELEDQRRELEQQHQQWQADRDESEKQLSQRTEQLNTRWADLNRQREALEQEPRQWDAKRAEEEGRLSQPVEQLDPPQAELEAQPEDLEGCHQQREAEPAAIESEQVEPAADSEQAPEHESQGASQEAPIDLAEVFRRMGSVELLRDDEAQGGPPAEPGPEPEPSANPPAGQPSPPSRPAADREDESIDDYMSRLMERVHAAVGDAQQRDSQPQDPQPQDPQPRQPIEPESQAASEATRPDEPPTPQFAAPKRRKPEEMSPRAVAPEKVADLSAMRELANLSAHSAIDRHARRQTMRATWGKLLITATALLVGGGLLRLWWAKGTSNVTFYAAMVSFVVALFWGGQYAALIGRMLANKLGRLDRKSRKDRNSYQGKATSDGQEASPRGDPRRVSEDPPQTFDDELKSLVDAGPQR